VSGKQVYVSTAYEVESAQSIHKLMRWGPPAIAVCFLLATVVASLKKQIRWQWTTLGSLLIVSGFFLSIEILEYIQSPQGPGRLRSMVASLPRLWLATGVIGTMGIVAAAWLGGRQVSTSRLVAVIGAALVVAFLALVPSDPLVFPPSAVRPLTWLMVLLGGVCGWASRGKSWKGAIAVSLLIPVLVVAFLAYVQITNTNVEEANAEHPSRFWLLTGLLGQVAFFALGRCWAWKSEGDDAGSLTWLPRLGSLTLLALVGTHFYLDNFLLPVQGMQRSVVCVDAESGALLWERGFQTTHYERIHRKNSHATPTPVSDGTAVYAYFGDAGMVCLEADGRQRWLNTNLPYRDKYGAASSPVLGSGLVFLSSLDLEKPSILALDQQTGEIRWQQFLKLEKLVGSYAAPWYGTLQGREQLVINGARRLLGLDPATGQILWSHHHDIGEVIPSPIVVDDLIIGGGDRTLAVFRVASEYATDANPELVWESNRSAPFHCSVVAFDNHLGTLTDEGVFTCLDRESGRPVWKKRLDGSYTSSPVRVGDLLYLINRDGVTTIIDCSEHGEIVAANGIGEATEASLAVAEGRIFIRGERHLFCIDDGSGLPDAPAVRPEVELSPRKVVLD
jgi:outer membrane protein assembly factor BamB